MDKSEPHLHFFCGKIGAGKSTLASKIAGDSKAILINEDHWTSTLWPGEITNLKDYGEKSTRLKKALWPMVSQVLQTGTCVVLDFPANTISQRRTLKTLIEMADVPHTLHLLDTSDEICKSRLRVRNASGDHQYEVTEEQFEQFSSFFEPPSSEEAFNVKVWPCLE
ncbi:MAG: AAA family ATPase [Kordiimonas sp.]